MTTETRQPAPTHVAPWHPDMLARVEAQGISAQQLIGNTGVRLSDLDGDTPRLSFAVIAELFERAADLTGDDHFGLHLGQEREMRRLGLMAFVGQSAPSVQSLLHNLARYQRVFGDAIEIDASGLDQTGAVTWAFGVSLGVPRRRYNEFEGAGLIHWLRQLTARHMRPKAVTFRHHRRDGQDNVAQFFGCPVRFGDAENSLVFHPSDLDLTLRTADDYLYRMLTRYAEQALQSVPTRTSDLAQAVEQAISHNLRAGQADVAKSLGLSTRTLARRLRALGTTFLGIADRYKAALAKRLLTETDMQVIEIAFALGYTNPSTFSTAFKRWTGKAPSDFRK